MKITKKDIYKLINRDNDIYERIYVEYVTKITVYIDSIVRNKESAKDLSSEIFIKLPELVKDSYDFSKGDFDISINIDIYFSTLSALLIM